MEFDTSFYGVASTSSSFRQSHAAEAYADLLEDEDMHSYDGFGSESMNSDYSVEEPVEGDEHESSSEGSLDGLVLESEPEVSSRASSSEVSDDGEDEEETKMKNSTLQAGTEMLRLRFPSLSLSIRLADFCCLVERDLLNDTIVDFYLNHIVEHLLPDDESSPRVTVLPAVFWHNLSLIQSGLNTADLASLSQEEKLDQRFGDVFEFLDDFELVDVDYILVPFNEWQHWSLAVVCNPSSQNEACIALFDSELHQDANDLRACATLLDEFLSYAYTRRMGVPRPATRLPWLVPEDLAQQHNEFDSGLFILEFARRFLMAPPHMVFKGFNFAAEYSDFTTVGKRKEIQKIILSLCPDRKLWLPLLDIIDRVKY